MARLDKDEGLDRSLTPVAPTRIERRRPASPNASSPIFLSSLACALNKVGGEGGHIKERLDESMTHGTSSVPDAVPVSRNARAVGHRWSSPRVLSSLTTKTLEALEPKRRGANINIRRVRLDTNEGLDDLRPDDVVMGSMGSIP